MKLEIWQDLLLSTIKIKIGLTKNTGTLSVTFIRLVHFANSQISTVNKNNSVYFSWKEIYFAYKIKKNEKKVFGLYMFL